ncbi:MAG: hypothetical protein EXR98_04285 [Gemmataceae bacterium]|nr:hypothetical protein [Gemmataceae bacterium]
MPFIYLLLFALICLQPGPSWPAPPLESPGCEILVVTMMLTSWLTAGLIAKAICWQMVRHPEQRSSLVRRYARWRRYHFISLLVAYMALLYLLGWGSVLTETWINGTPWLTDLEKQQLFEGRDVALTIPGKEISLLVPFLVALVLSWERFYLVEKTAYELVHDADRYLSRRTYLVLQIRHQMLLVMPPILLLLLQQILFTLFPNWNRDSYLPALIATALMGATFVSMPILLRLLLGLKPLPPGPLRDRLENTARRLGIGYSNVLVWNTRNLLANALVTGFVPWVRYIVLTDRLIEELTPDEIEAVFGHEVGHIKHHHLFFYLAFFVTSYIFLGMFWEVVKWWITQEEVRSSVSDIWEMLKTLSSFGKVGLLASYTMLAFGFISRRCEQQADLFSAGTVSSDAFISALEKVAYINGIPRDRAGNWLLSWQHPTIAQRVHFLEEMRDHPTRIPGFHRGIFLMQWVFYVTLAYLLWSFSLPDVWKLLAEF